MRHRSDIPRRSTDGMNAAPPIVRRRNSPPLLAAAADDPWLAPPGQPGWPGTLRASRRLLLLVLWTLFAMPTQAVCLMLPGAAKVRFAQLYWRGIVRLLGVRVRVVGAPEAGGRPVLFVSNHSSWVDIGVLGGVLPGCFVAKGEIDNWPVIKWIARLGRTVFVSRRRNATGREVDLMRARLSQGDNIILFPEGTTSYGTVLRPFRSAFFALADGDAGPIVQPVSLAYDRLAGLPTGRLARGAFAWVGDEDIASHYWRLAQCAGVRATVLLHRPIDPRAYAGRKALSQAVQSVVAEGAARLYQNRVATPL